MHDVSQPHAVAIWQLAALRLSAGDGWVRLEAGCAEATLRGTDELERLRRGLEGVLARHNDYRTIWLADRLSCRYRPESRAFVSALELWFGETHVVVDDEGVFDALEELIECLRGNDPRRTGDDVAARLRELKPVLTWCCDPLLDVSAGTNWVSIALSDEEPVRIRGAALLADFRRQLRRLLDQETGSLLVALTPELSVTYNKGDFRAADSLTFRARGGKSVFLEGAQVFNLCHDLDDWLGLVLGEPGTQFGCGYTGASHSSSSVCISQGQSMAINTRGKGRLAALLLDAVAGRVAASSTIHHNRTAVAAVTRYGQAISIQVGDKSHAFGLSAAAHLAAVLLLDSPATAMLTENICTPN